MYIIFSMGIGCSHVPSYMTPITSPHFSDDYNMFFKTTEHRIVAPYNAQVRGIHFSKLWTHILYIL
jgi:hypothetical protein